MLEPQLPEASELIYTSKVTLGGQVEFVQYYSRFVAVGAQHKGRRGHTFPKEPAYLFRRRNRCTCFISLATPDEAISRSASVCL